VNFERDGVAWAFHAALPLMPAPPPPGYQRGNKSSLPAV